MSAGPTGTPLTRKVTRKLSSSTSCCCAMNGIVASESLCEDLSQALHILIALDQRPDTRQGTERSMPQGLGVHALSAEDTQPGEQLSSGGFLVDLRQIAEAPEALLGRRAGRRVEVWESRAAVVTDNTGHAFHGRIDEYRGEVDTMKNAAA